MTATLAPRPARAARTRRARQPPPARTRRARQPPPRRRPVHRRPINRALARARSGRRLNALLLTYLLLTLALGWRLFEIQVRSAPQFRELAARQTQRQVEIPARRGKLYDRSGEPLAMSVATATVYANPRLLHRSGIDPAEVAGRLASLLGKNASDLENVLRRDKAFVYLARQLPRSVGDAVLALELPGVQVMDEPKRVYPAGSLAAQVVGFAGIDNVGLSGLERRYDALLAGQPGQLLVEHAPQGLEISSAPRVGELPVAGTDLVLTIDREIQSTAERLLEEAVREYDAQGASAVVLDVASGEILAMASMPSYEPERIAAADGYARRNRVVTDMFEPGSVSKMITAAAALEEGVVRPGQRIPVGSSYEVSGKRFTDSGAPAESYTFAEVIENSSNIGTIRVAERLGAERLYRYLRDFGYGNETALSFPGESSGLLAEPADWSGTSLPTIAIGHGVSVTLLQIAQACNTIANAGEYRDAVLVRGSVGSDGRLEPARSAATRQVVSAATARTLTNMLVTVVESGTGTNAAIPGYEVAGKTGTAQKPSTRQRGYEPGAYVGAFAGFAPAADPRLVIAVLVDEPQKARSGGATAAPVFSKLMHFALQHQRVPPSDPNALDPAPSAET